MNIDVKKLSQFAVLPSYKHSGDSGFDLYATETVIIFPGETKVIPTGLSFEIPTNFELQIRPRSGVSSHTKLRIANAPGTIDANYRGEVGIIVDNIAMPEFVLNENQSISIAKNQLFYLTIDTDFFELQKNFDKQKDSLIFLNQDNPTLSGTYCIRKGDRIAQGVIASVELVSFVEKDFLNNTSRGESGFGSTGYN